MASTRLTRVAKEQRLWSPMERDDRARTMSDELSSSSSLATLLCLTVG